jgi:predicted component of type VI protein secretion system
MNEITHNIARQIEQVFSLLEARQYSADELSKLNSDLNSFIHQLKQAQERIDQKIK